MSGIGEDGHPIFDGIRDCQAADYTMYAAAVLNDYLYLYSQVTDLDWEFSVNGGGTLKSVFEWAIGLTEDPNIANKYAQNLGGPIASRMANVCSVRKTTLFYIFRFT